MIRTVTISEAKANLSRLADDIAAGEKVVVSRAGKPVMKLVALSQEEIESADSKGYFRKLGKGAKYLENFSWEDWEESEREMEAIWRKFGYID